MNKVAELFEDISRHPLAVFLMALGVISLFVENLEVVGISLLSLGLGILVGEDPNGNT